MVPLRQTMIATTSIFCALILSTQLSAGERPPASEWGPEDERGAANRITPASVLAAMQLVKEGKIYELGRDYEAGMPLFPGRYYSLTIPGSPTGGPLGKNQVVYQHKINTDKNVRVRR